jgi:hypothetical protein
MIELNQNSIISNEFKRLVKTYMNYSVYLDLETILTDMEKLDAIRERTPKRIVKENATNCIKYLQQITKHCQNDDIKPLSIKQRWNGVDLVTEPFEIKKLERYGIDVVNYFKVNTGTVLELDYTDLINAINFECMYRDLGYEDKYVEHQLKDKGIFCVHDAECLDFIEKNCYAQGMYMKIGETPKKSLSDNKMYNYYGKEVDNVYYKETVETNASMTLNYICCKLLSKLENVENFTLWRACDNVITVYLKNQKAEEEIQDFLNGVSVRIFGRQFFFESKKRVIKFE